MNDPHVEALLYWVIHDDSVNYTNARLPEYAHELVDIEANDRRVIIRPKEHYSNEEEARADLEGFIRHWEFEATLEDGSHCFQLHFLSANIIDRNPDPDPSGVIRANASPIHHIWSVSTPTVTVGKSTYPGLPHGPIVNPDIPVVQKMLAQLDMYHRNRALLAAMVYFCLTTLEASVPDETEGNGADQRTRNYYAISRSVLRKVRDLSSNKGGSEARKVGGTEDEFTSREKAFLVTTVKEFIKRAAQKSTYPAYNWPTITLADLPEVDA